MTIEQAIKRSISHTEIVTLDYSAELAEALELECEDSVDANGVLEAWGKDEAGEEWRVHLAREANGYR